MGGLGPSSACTRSAMSSAATKAACAPGSCQSPHGGAAPERDGRQEQLERTMDRIRDKFGKNAIQFGATAGSEKEEDLPL